MTTNFVIRVIVKDKENKVHKLAKNNVDLKADGRDEIVEFEEDGKKFPILIKNLKVSRDKKGEFVEDFRLLPAPGSDFTIEKAPPYREGWFETNTERWNVVEVPRKRSWTEKPVLLAFAIIITLLVIGGIIAGFILWKRKQRERERQ